MWMGLEQDATNMGSIEGPLENQRLVGDICSHIFVANLLKWFML